MKAVRSTFLAALCVVTVSGTAPMLAQDVSKINKWFDDIDKKYPNLNRQRKTGPTQQAGEIQKAGNIQVPTGIKAIKTVKVPCSERFLIGADTLFEFDKATLNPKAEETLNVLAPMIQRLGPHPIVVEGHTDAIGTDDYNQQLSERRAERVKNWLLQNHVAEPKALRIVGYGEQRPIAPNTKPDGSDNPVGRAQNRRVVIIVNTCKSIDDVASASASTASGADEKADAALKGSDRPADVSASGTSSGAPEREAAE